MQSGISGPVAAEITRRLTDALDPAHLQVIDDSEAHRGHAGHDPRGESHFTVVVVSERFASMNRVQRQRAVNEPLRDLLEERIHALHIRAKAPGE